MKKTIFLCLVIITSITYFSCTRQETIDREKLVKTIDDYVKKNIPEQRTLDSISILKIDSLTDFTYIMFYQQFLENSIEMLNMEMNLALTMGDAEKAAQKSEKISEVWSKSDLYSAYIEDHKGDDKTPFKMYFVITKVYYKLPDKTQEIQDMGFPIDKDFKVVELNLENGPNIND